MTRLRQRIAERLKDVFRLSLYCDILQWSETARYETLFPELLKFIDSHENLLFCCFHMYKTVCFEYFLVMMTAFTMGMAVL